MNDLKEGFFGRVAAFVCVIEFQKRGLPHAHILLNLIEEDKITTPEEIDELVCAEIPDPDINPKLHGIVKKFMIHGPCGIFNPLASCMKDKEGGMID